MGGVELNSYQWETLRALANALVPSLNANSLAFKREYEEAMSRMYPEIHRKLRLMLLVLSFRGPAATFTFSPRLVTEMSKEEVADFMLGLARSRIALLRNFVAGLLSLTQFVMYRQQPEFRRIVGDLDTHPQLLELQKHANQANVMWFIPKLSIPQPLSSDTLPILSTEVAIVGSGSSAMVAAYRLTQQGYRVLLIEKGYHISALTSPSQCYAREQQAFESGMLLTSRDASISVLAGSTVGGGGAVNWSCSLRPTEQVRNQFVQRGAPLYGEPAFDEAIEAVERVMGVKDHASDHSFTNKLILDSAQRLGYPAKATGQNTGSHHHNSGFVEFGSRQGAEEGGVAEWLRYSLENGAQLLQRAQVVNIRHRNGYATGLEVIVDGERPVIVSCKRVICAGGALNTPVLLQKSKFKNPHIGRGLKLHPVTVAYGEFPHVEVNKRLDPIMTAVSTQADNLDGLGHGPKIEAIHHRPLLVTQFMPYRGPADWQSRANAYKHLCALLVITRDKGHGSVSYNPVNAEYPMLPYIDYTPSDYDLEALHQGSLVSANMLYVGGAERIFLSSPTVPDFVSTKPAEQRSIWDSDFRAWYELAEKDKFVVYGPRIGSAHQMATCRMTNRGPQHGAVDERGRLYECPNVHVIDASVFPAASGVNPMITCMATAYALTQYVVDDLVRLQTKL